MSTTDPSPLKASGQGSAGRGRGSRWPTTRRRPLATLLAAVVLAASLAPPAQADRWYTRERVLGVVDAGRRPAVARQAGVGWGRLLLLWQEIQPGGPDDWLLDRYLDRADLRTTLDSGLPLVAVVQGTPGWAAGNWRDGAAGVPTGLDHPVDDPRNTFGRFMLRLVRAFGGRIEAWVIWNEPDLRPGEAGDWWTWGGNTADFASLLRAGWRAVKRADPEAQVVFPATTYFADAVNGRELFLSRVLRETARDPEAAGHGSYFDAVAVNLYCSLDAIRRVPELYAAVLGRHRLAKPIWLTETNCPVEDDAPGPEEPAPEELAPEELAPEEPGPAALSGRISAEDQAAFLLQAVALARAAGFQRVAWYSLLDHDPRTGIPERWGLLRADGRPRAALGAFRLAATYLADARQLVRLAPLGNTRADGWPVWRVVLDEPWAGRRLQLLWRAADGPDAVRLAADGGQAWLLRLDGSSTPLQQRRGWWDVGLPAARERQPNQPPGFQRVGDPVLVVESGLPRVRRLDELPLGLL